MILAGSLKENFKVMNMDCSKTEDFFEERRRMCKCYTELCDGCPISIKNNGIGVNCEDLVELYTQEAVVLIQKWSDEHPKLMI